MLFLHQRPQFVECVAPMSSRSGPMARTDPLLLEWTAIIRVGFPSFRPKDHGPVPDQGQRRRNSYRAEVLSGHTAAVRQKKRRQSEQPNQYADDNVYSLANPRG